MEGNQPIITKYKKLTQSFLRDNPYVDEKNASQNPNKTIYTTKDKKDYETKKLEKQQTKFLSGQWQKVKTHIQEKSLMYETQRYPAYLDYDLMEYYPIIGQALDILMEESTTVNSEGKILNIFSESKRVQDELKELFYNRLNIHTTLPMWIRNMPVRKNSMIPLLDGSIISIEELSKKIKAGEEVWTYSVQQGTNDVVSGKIVWCDLTRESSKIVRVNLTDGTFVDTTPDHEYMLKDGSLKAAQDLKAGESLMPFNHIEIFVSSVVELEEVDDVYCMEVLGENGEHDRHNFAICSVDENGEYGKYGVFVSNCKYGDNFVYLQIDDEMGIVGTRQLANIEVERVEGSTNARSKPILKNEDDEVIFRWKSTDIAEFKYWQIAHFRLLVDDRRLPYGVSVLEKARRIWKNLLLVEDAMRTIRLLRAIDRRVYYINVGNIDPNDVQAYVEDIASRFKRKRHIDEYTGQEDLKYNVMGYDQDYFIPIRDANEGTKIDTLAGASNIDQIADIEYDLNQLFAALGIPKPFLQYDAAAGEGKNLAMADVRFARKINRIQQAALQELNKIAMVHLMLLGLDDELHNFELSLNNPSVQADVMRTEQFAAKINSFKDAVADASNGISALSVTMAMKRILGMTDDEVKLNLEQQFMERIAAEELKNAATKVSSSTLFDGILKLYGIESTGDAPAAPTGSTLETMSSGGGGGNFVPTGALETGGGEMGGAELGGETGMETPAPEATAPEAPAETPAETPEAPAEIAEGFVNHKADKLITEEEDELERILRIMNKMK
jgi:hypothetical protein